MGWKGHSVRELAQGDLADASSPFYQALARFHKPEEINPQQATRKFGDFDRMRQWGDCNVFVTLDKTGHITSTATAFSIPASRSLYGQRVGVIEYV
ncbi:MAG: hypothetical protein ABIP54_03575, partial [Candidatus Andersenbacteria bacterium]